MTYVQPDHQDQPWASWARPPHLLMKIPLLQKGLETPRSCTGNGEVGYKGIVRQMIEIQNNLDFFTRLDKKLRKHLLSILCPHILLSLLLLGVELGSLLLRIFDCLLPQTLLGIETFSHD